jgi:hypothetical protein
VKVILSVTHKGKEYFFRRDALWSDSRAQAKQFDSAKVKTELLNVRRSLRHLSGLKISALPAKARVRKNPSRRDATERADDLLASFTGERATKELKVSARPIKTGLVVGKLSGVMYEATRDGVTDQYFHKFKKSARPLLISDHDGSQLGIVGGRFRFTERGIVDVGQ